MDERDWLAQRFEAHRTHLQAVACQMLRSRTEADDAVQEAWLRLSRSDTRGVENLRGWLTTVVGRVCLDMLRSREQRREAPLSARPDDAVVSYGDRADPEHEAVMADSVGLALQMVLDTLDPAERLAFVLHDMFAVPFDEIAPIVDRSPGAARQLASRARRRIQGADTFPATDLTRQRQIVDAFLEASRNGDFADLITLLDPDIVFRADPTAVLTGASAELRGAAAVAGTFSGRAQTAQLALLDGAIGAVWAPRGQPRFAFRFAITHGRITEIHLIGDPERLRQIDLTILGD